MQPSRVVFPDIELVVCQYLRTTLAGRPEAIASAVFVGDKVPATRRDRMVVVRRDGGRQFEKTTEAARLGIRVWAKTDQDATDLARLVRAVLWAMPDGAPVCRVNDLGGPSPVADESEQPLQFMTLEFVVRGVDLPAA